MFKDVVGRHALRLAEVRAFDDGAVRLRYDVRG
jgi:hypothetical protein